MREITRKERKTQLAPYLRERHGEHKETRISLSDSLFTPCLCVSLFVFILISSNSFSQTKKKIEKPIAEITVQYTDSLPGDFGFVKDWSYTEGIYKNNNGEVRCDGICPPAIERMKDEAGNIYKDSLKAYFKLLDTTHYYHTLQCEAWIYEFAGTNFINCFINASGFINCYTMNNVATHSSLRLSINGDKCIPTIYLTSILQKTGSKIFKCSSGFIRIDSGMLAKGILKAEFDFNFLNTLEPDKPMYWKGKILSPITEF